MQKSKINMDIKYVKDIIRIIKKEPLSVIIILTLIFVPYIIQSWFKLFPESWQLIITLVFIILLIYALFRLKEEIKILKRKTALINYLKKEKRHSFDHFKNQWIANKEFTKENIEKLILEFPEELKTVRIKNRGLGVGLVQNIQKVKNIK